jgi:hypothetical protein
VTPSVSTETTCTFCGLLACSLSDTTVVLSYTDVEEAGKAKSSSIRYSGGILFGLEAKFVVLYYILGALMI